MRTLVVSQSQANKRIDRVLKEAFSQMPASALYKAFRKRDIRANGIRVREDHILSEGDVIQVYIVDEILDGRTAAADSSKLTRGFTVVFEDRNLLIVNKEQGIPVHPDKDTAFNTLIDMVIKYLSDTGAYDPADPSAFTPSLCHRLDRNTGGLLMVAKTEAALSILTAKIKAREIRKYYQCLVYGHMEKNSGELKAYLEKDENKSRVFIKDRKSRNSLEIITRYRVLSRLDDMSLLEVELVTGRTHQIRAHLAHIGHPIVGDGKYGLNTINRASGAKYQALWAYKLVFDFKDGGSLNYLKGRVFEVEPEFRLKEK